MMATLAASVVLQWFLPLDIAKVTGQKVEHSTNGSNKQ